MLSTTYSLDSCLNITENIKKAHYDEDIGCGIFVDLQKASDTADHQILLAKLNDYGICGVSKVGLNPICLIPISM